MKKNIDDQWGWLNSIIILLIWNIYFIYFGNLFFNFMIIILD